MIHLQARRAMRRAAVVGTCAGLLLGLAACGIGEEPQVSAAEAAQTPAEADRNRAVVLRYMQEVVNERKFEVLDELMVEDWIAHNPGEPNGREGLKTFFAGLFEQVPELHADVKRVVAEGDLVVVHTHYTIAAVDRGNDWAAGSSAAADFFRLENGQIVEHWDVLQRPIPESSVNGNTMFDGGALYNYR